MTGQTPTQLGLLLALRRVRQGHVIRIASGLFLDRGARIPGHLADCLRELLDEGHLRLDEASPEWDQQPVRTTPSGERLRRRLERTASGGRAALA